ncbi:acetyl-coenzyme A carboxylase carboxyl transferase subunit alpha [Lacticaseibacillus thailandensis DSM 22698 = JCM 13996]|uniref:acetyl-CoA carboxytransferase n=1 Tax=Lacticaseibacillus thailandensis DSM 22698 = JCM 13996 TaxID=1423810 RepID=A0A0R2CI37_9LACO|nr:acetyl-coenzyme A carboxylase carboxyl transferase subunit alpha [Lacticaseibacillus thailandensis DSM 22698 = JCM 13996]
MRQARSQDKVSTPWLIAQLLTHFHELHGDQAQGDDPAIIGGVGLLVGQPVTVIATNKGQTLAESQACHFGCATPAGYRKAIRLMQQAAKFGRPVLNLINTPGAFLGVDAEYQGQGQAIAQCIMTGVSLPVPMVSVIVGEAGSGGALALACGDRTWMFAQSTYSVLSPEGYASILWRDGQRAAEAAEHMRLTPPEILADGIVDRVIPEVTDVPGAQQLGAELAATFTTLGELPTQQLLAARHERYRNFGVDGLQE